LIESPEYAVYPKQNENKEDCKLKTTQMIPSVLKLSDSNHFNSEEGRFYLTANGTTITSYI
jgi:hypothetical protein